MDSSDPLSPFSTNKLIKTRERTPFNQVMTIKSSSVKKMLQMLQRAAQQSCIRVCQLLCLPLDSVWCEKAVCCSAQYHQPKEDKDTQVAFQSPPSTILIVNISNSTLIDCVIGNDTYQAAVAEVQPLTKESELQIHGQVRCSCSCGQQGAAQAPPPPPPPPASCPHLPSAERLSIGIHGSHLNCVIIGDNNYMHAEQSQE